MIWSPPIKLSFFCLRGNDFSVRLGLRDVAGLRDGLVLGLVAWPSGTGFEAAGGLAFGGVGFGATFSGTGLEVSAGLGTPPSGTGLETACCLGCGSSLGTGGLGAWPSA